MITLLIAVASLTLIPLALGLAESLRVPGYRPGDYDYLRKARQTQRRRR